MVECGSAGVRDRGIKGMCNVFMGSEVYCLLYGDEYYGHIVLWLLAENPLTMILGSKHV
jgi:hypothetical protein